MEKVTAAATALGDMSAGLTREVSAFKLATDAADTVPTAAAAATELDKYREAA